MSDQNGGVTRLGSVVGVRPELLDQYCRLHADPWPEVLAENTRAGISNYSIFLLREQNLLFSYSEYRGTDRAAAIERMSANPKMQEWWNLCRPCQVPLVSTSGARLWTSMERVFYQP